MQLFSSNFKLGILGGGQLGKMLLYDAKRYDLHTKVMDLSDEVPCAKIADEFIVGDITNYNDVIDFGNKVDVITVEIEKINTEALLELEKRGKKVYPSAKALQIIQNKSDQKQFYKKNNLPTSRFSNYSNLDELKSRFKKDNFKFPFVWKSSKFGYDGKGVKIIKSPDDLNFSYKNQCLIEELVEIKKELSSNIFIAFITNSTHNSVFSDLSVCKEEFWVIGTSFLKIISPLSSFSSSL